MFVDSLLRLSDAQAVTSDAASTNTIDLGNVTPKRGIGTGEPMEVVLTVDVAADHTTGDETYEFQFIQSANADLSSPDILELRVIAAADLSAGSVHHLPIPKGAITKRYVGVFYNTGGTTPTVTVTADLVPQSFAEARATYAGGFTVS